MMKEQTQLKSKIDVINKTIESGLAMLSINQYAARSVLKVRENGHTRAIKRTKKKMNKSKPGRINGTFTEY